MFERETRRPRCSNVDLNKDLTAILRYGKLRKRGPPIGIECESIDGEGRRWYRFQDVVDALQNPHNSRSTFQSEIMAVIKSSTQVLEGSRWQPRFHLRGNDDFAWQIAVSPKGGSRRDAVRRRSRSPQRRREEQRPTPARPPPPLRLGERTPTQERCAICFAEPSTHAFAPCGHQCVCGGCSDIIMESIPQRCPMCRTEVVMALQIFS